MNTRSLYFCTTVYANVLIRVVRRRSRPDRRLRRDNSLPRSREPFQDVPSSAVSDGQQRLGLRSAAVPTLGLLLFMH